MKLKLESIINNLNVIHLAGEVERKDITSIAYDSRKVKRDSIFVAIKGFKSDGHTFIMDAVSNGATAVIIEDDSKVSNDYLSHQNVTKILVPNSRIALADISSKFYGDPSKHLKMIAVTGTNGKTTITYLIKSILEEGGNQVGLVGTVENYIGDDILPADKTTPESLELNELFSKMRNAGCGYCVMEVSSHALELERVRGIDFCGAIFTNLTQEHLDFHLNMENYFHSKKKLFDGLNSSAIAITNFDDDYGRKIILNSKAKYFSFGSRSIYDYYFTNSRFDFASTNFAVKSKTREFKINSNLIGRFNLYNITASAAFCSELGVNDSSIVNGIKNVGNVPGRFQVVSRGYPLTVIVDYSHTPDALENCLAAIREVLSRTSRSSKVATVFGAGGNRDRTKRPLMGKAVQKFSDRIYVTSDNPRYEEPVEIINDIMSGIVKNGPVKIVENREEAIRSAILESSENDVVLIAGKGHENYQEIKGIRTHFDDKEVAQKYLKEKFGK